MADGARLWWVPPEFNALRSVQPMTAALERCAGVERARSETPAEFSLFVSAPRRTPPAYRRLLNLLSDSTKISKLQLLGSEVRKEPLPREAMVPALPGTMLMRFDVLLRPCLVLFTCKRKKKFKRILPI